MAPKAKLGRGPPTPIQPPNPKSSILGDWRQDCDAIGKSLVWLSERFKNATVLEDSIDLFARLSRSYETATWVFDFLRKPVHNVPAPENPIFEVMLSDVLMGHKIALDTLCWIYDTATNLNNLETAGNPKQQPQTQTKTGSGRQAKAKQAAARAGPAIVVGRRHVIDLDETTPCMFPYLVHRMVEKILDDQNKLRSMIIIFEELEQERICEGMSSTASLSEKRWNLAMIVAFVSGSHAFNFWYTYFDSKLHVPTQEFVHALECFLVARTDSVFSRGRLGMCCPTGIKELDQQTLQQARPPGLKKPKLKKEESSGSENGSDDFGVALKALHKQDTATVEDEIDARLQWLDEQEIMKSTYDRRNRNRTKTSYIEALLTNTNPPMYDTECLPKNTKSPFEVAADIFCQDGVDIYNTQFMEEGSKDSEIPSQDRVTPPSQPTTIAQSLHHIGSAEDTSDLYAQMKRNRMSSMVEANRSDSEGFFMNVDTTEIARNLCPNIADFALLTNHFGFFNTMLLCGNDEEWLGRDMSVSRRSAGSLIVGSDQAKWLAQRKKKLVAQTANEERMDAGHSICPNAITPFGSYDRTTQGKAELPRQEMAVKEDSVRPTSTKVVVSAQSQIDTNRQSMQANSVPNRGSEMPPNPEDISSAHFGGTNTKRNDTHSRKILIPFMTLNDLLGITKKSGADAKPAGSDKTRTVIGGEEEGQILLADRQGPTPLSPDDRRRFLILLLTLGVTNVQEVKNLDLQNSFEDQGMRVFEPDFLPCEGLPYSVIRKFKLHLRAGNLDVDHILSKMGSMVGTQMMDFVAGGGGSEVLEDCGFPSLSSGLVISFENSEAVTMLNQLYVHYLRGLPPLPNDAPKYNWPGSKTLTTNFMQWHRQTYKLGAAEVMKSFCASNSMIIFDGPLRLWRGNLQSVLADRPPAEEPPQTPFQMNQKASPVSDHAEEKKERFPFWSIPNVRQMPIPASMTENVMSLLLWFASMPAPLRTAGEGAGTIVAEYTYASDVDEAGIQAVIKSQMKNLYPHFNWRKGKQNVRQHIGGLTAKIIPILAELSQKLSSLEQQFWTVRRLRLTCCNPNLRSASYHSFEDAKRELVKRKEVLRHKKKIMKSAEDDTQNVEQIAIIREILVNVGLVEHTVDNWEKILVKNSQSWHVDELFFQAVLKKNDNTYKTREKSLLKQIKTANIEYFRLQHLLSLCESKYETWIAPQGFEEVNEESEDEEENRVTPTKQSIKTEDFGDHDIDMSGELQAKQYYQNVGLGKKTMKARFSMPSCLTGAKTLPKRASFNTKIDVHRVQNSRLRYIPGASNLWMQDLIKSHTGGSEETFHSHIYDKELSQMVDDKWKLLDSIGSTLDKVTEDYDIHIQLLSEKSTELEAIKTYVEEVLAQRELMDLCVELEREELLTTKSKNKGGRKKAQPRSTSPSRF